jgi:prevent-host-death family protein
MSEQHSIADARSNLAELVRKAEAGEAVELTRRGKRVAVLIGLREYKQLTGRPRKTFAEAYAEWRSKVDWSQMGDPDDVFADVRDRDPGRDVDL